MKVSRKGRGRRDAPVWPVSPRVEQWMTRPAVTIEASARVSSAVAAMKAHGVRHLPVLGPDGTLAGIVTDRDLRQVVFDPSIQELLGKAADKLRGLTVRDVMTWGVVAVRPDMGIREAAGLMHQRKIGALPVVERGRVTGMLTERDVLRAFEEMLQGHVQGVRPIPATEAGSETYDYGFPEPIWGEPWQNEGEVD
jgi:acetoin utilization protein AcuB